MPTNEDEKTRLQVLADNMMIWLPKISAGKRLQVTYKDGMVAEILGIISLIENIKDGNEIRLKVIAFPDAPDGEEWHNPDKLTAEQVGIEDGWRLLLVSEIVDGRELHVCESFIDEREWIDGFSGWRLASTYRVKASEHPVGSLKPKEPKGFLTYFDERELQLRLYSSGYQAGHNDTVEGIFSDDPRGDDAENIHGEAVTEIAKDHETSKPNPLDENERKAILDDIYKGCNKLELHWMDSAILAHAIMDGRISEHITVS